MPTSKHRKNHKQKVTAYKARKFHAQKRVEKLLTQANESVSVWDPKSDRNVITISGADMFKDED